MAENEQGHGEEGEDEAPATAAQIKQLIRRKLRKREAEEEAGLNIYPLMDVMTILLVFMIIQFAQESANVVTSAHLQIPYSTAITTPSAALRLTIADNQILVENREVIGLRPGGLVDPQHKQGGGTGFLITPLHDLMTQHRDRLKTIERLSNGRQPFRGEIQIIADRRTPFRTLSEVIYTLGQSEFSRMHFVVLQGNFE